MSRKKLIEVSIPLEAINTASAKEKSLRHMHPSTLHLWWARRPLAAARAVLWASLVDDPGNDEDRSRLHDIMKRLVQWDTTHVVNPQALKDALAELPPDLPEFLDPFSGGGSIPLEAHRLGLVVHARDLNPVAVMLNKAMIEIPPKFSGMPHVHPDRQKTARGLLFSTTQDGASGLAQDVNYYGQLLRDKAFAEIGRMYPRVNTPEGDAAVIAWLWARTVKCNNPACGKDMPLVSSFTLSKKHNAYVAVHTEGGKLTYTVENGTAPKDKEVKIGKAKFKCAACGNVVSNDYLHEQFSAHEDGRVLLAVVAEGKKGRMYLTPDDEQVRAADVPMPEDFPDEEMNQDTTDLISGRGYGFTHWHQLFTNRQLTMLTTFCGLLSSVEDEVKRDALTAGLSEEDAKEYAKAVRVYLAFVIDKLTDRNSSICSWDTGYEKIRNTFGRQAIPMVWDYAEGNPFSDSSGSFRSALGWVVEVLEQLPASVPGEASQHDAMTPESLRNVIVSTDPPYYDNIGYSDLSDYFYIWMRENLREIYPSLFRRTVAPKDEELIATPYRHDNDEQKARKFFEDGMLTAFRNVYQCASDEYPVTIYYAYKQKDTEDDGVVSNGWETMLKAVIDAGFQVTATWPIRTELANRSLAHGTNALGSSVVLVCRKRPVDAKGMTRQEFMRELEDTLRPAIEKFQKEKMSPVDIPQAAIGVGMSVYSQYSRIVSMDGHEMTVREALSETNAAVDEILIGVDLDGASRFCVSMYRIGGFDFVDSDEAIRLATARNVALDSMLKRGLIVKDESSVYLAERENLKGNDDVVWAVMQRLAYALEAGGRDACGNVIAHLRESNNEGSVMMARELAYLLYTIAEGRKWTKEAYMYNSLASEWDKIMEVADKIKHAVINPQGTFTEELEAE